MRNDRRWESGSRNAPGFALAGMRGDGVRTGDKAGPRITLSRLEETASLQSQPTVSEDNKATATTKCKRHRNVTYHALPSTRPVEFVESPKISLETWEVGPLRPALPLLGL